MTTLAMHPVSGEATDRALVLLTLLLLALAFGLGLARLAIGRPRLWRGAARLGWWRTGAFVAGLAVIALALAGPVDDLAEHSLAGHMAQHMLLIVVAAPLLAAAAPGVPLLLVLPVHQRARVARLRQQLRRRTSTGWLFLPVTAWVVHVMVLWGWHLPAAFDAADRSPLLHATEHAMLLASAWAFWWHVLAAPVRAEHQAGAEHGALPDHGAFPDHGAWADSWPRRSLTGPLAVLYVFATMLPMSALGAVLTFAGSPLYPGQVRGSLEAGLNPLTDQQLAGLVMWVPSDVVYLLVCVALFLPWLTDLAGQDDADVVPTVVGGGVP